MVVRPGQSINQSINQNQEDVALSTLTLKGEGIIQAKKFLKGDWLKGVVFEPNMKYLHVGILFPWQPIWLCFDFGNIVERFPE